MLFGIFKIMKKTIKLSAAAQEHLEFLIEITNQPEQILIEQALNNFAREMFLQKTNAEYEQLKRDPHAWTDFVQECEEWDVTLLDGE